MIKMYNDTDTAWRVGKPASNGTVKISAGNKVDGVFKGVSILAPADGLSVEKMSSTKTNKFIQVYDGPTSVYYGKYDNLPNIGTQGTNKPMYFIAKDIRGCRIKDITRQDVFIFSYAIIKGTLYMILSVKDSCKAIDITLWDKSTELESTTTFNLVDDSVKTVTAANKTHEPPMYKIRSMRPSRPTTAILVKTADEDLINPELLKSDKHEIYWYTDENGSSDVISQILSDGFSAITIFTSLEDVIDDDFGEYDDTVTYLRTAFNQVNIMLGGQPSPRIIKR